MSMVLQPHPPVRSADWFSWLSRSDLEPVLVYEYGLVFARNELQADDIPYFNHEFLQSMGITVAKHRLEILKLAWKEKGAAGMKPLSGLITAISKTRKSFSKYISRLVSHEETGTRAPKDQNKLPRKHVGEKEMRDETMALKRSNLALSGPLVDSRVQDRFLLTHKSPKWSGPLYPPKSPVLSGPLYPTKSPKLSGPLPGPNRSPRVSGPQERMSPGPKLVHGGKLDNHDERSLWVQMFHDMKPT